MPRVKGGTTARARRKKYLKASKGYFGSKHRLFKTAKEQVQHSLVYAYRDRRQTKRNFRKLWITRINAACRMNDISYSRFINGLKIAGIDMNRKILSELAISDPKMFSNLVKTAKDALANPEKAKKEQKTVEVKKPAAKKTETKAEPKKATTKAAPKKPAAKKTTTKTAPKKTTAKKATTKAAPKKTTTKKATTKAAK